MKMRVDKRLITMSMNSVTTVSDGRQNVKHEVSIQSAIRNGCRTCVSLVVGALAILLLVPGKARVL